MLQIQSKNRNIPCNLCLQSAGRASSRSVDKESFREMLGVLDKILTCLWANQDPKGKKDKVYEACNSLQSFDQRTHHVCRAGEHALGLTQLQQGLGKMQRIPLCLFGKWIAAVLTPDSILQAIPLEAEAAGGGHQASIRYENITSVESRTYLQKQPYACINQRRKR